MAGFFNFDKVQKDFLSAKLKANKKRMICEWFTAHDESRQETYISDGHFFAVVPDEMCFISEGKHGRGVKVETLKKCRPDSETVLTDTGIIKKISTEKDNLHIFTTTDGEEIWIHEKYLKYFENMNCRYQGKDKKSPVMLYVLDRIVGCILPVNHKQ